MQKIGLYIHIPRTGGTFLRSYFADSAPTIKQVGHDRLSELDFDLTPYFKFAFIRNPWDWYVSRYFYFCRIMAVEAGVSITCDSGLMGNEFSKRFPTLKEHLLWGLENAENFWLTDRYKDMCFIDGADKIDFVFRFEDLKGNVKNLFSHLQIKPTISYSKFCQTAGGKFFNSTEHLHYSKYYDADLIELVHNNDSYIIERFGYEYEIR